MAKSILYLEDDDNARELFECHFKVRDYDIRTFATAEEAEKALIDFKPDIIVTDQKLGGSSLGWEFLKRSVELSPSSLRFILSGYSEEEMIVNSFKDGIIFDYILKKASFDEVEKKIEDAFNFLDILKKRNLSNVKLSNELEAQIYTMSLRELKILEQRMEYKEKELQKLHDLVEKSKK